MAIGGFFSEYIVFKMGDIKAHTTPRYDSQMGGWKNAAEQVPVMHWGFEELK